MEQHVEIITQAGIVSAQVFGTHNASTVLVIASATGVKQSFYKKFAQYMANQGVAVITFDYTGIGLSKVKPIQQVTHTAADWGKIDLEAVLQHTKRNYPHAKITILGHSIGGQLIGLAPSSVYAQKIVLVAAQTGYWKFWKGTSQLKMWANWHLLFPVLTHTFGYFPSKKISGMENLPPQVAKQWSAWCRQPNYLFDSIPEHELYFRQIHCNALSISISDDHFAPREAVNWLSQKYAHVNLQQLHLHPHDYNERQIGHFGIFREQFQPHIWPVLAQHIVS